MLGLALVRKYHEWSLFLHVPVFAHFSTRLFLFPTALGVFLLQAVGEFRYKLFLTCAFQALSPTMYFVCLIVMLLNEPKKS